MEARQILISDQNHPNRCKDKLEKLLAVAIHFTGNANKWATAEANAKYFGRAWVASAKGTPLEADGKTPFSYGSAQVIADEKEVVLAMPVDEVAWHAGDSRIIAPDGTKTQQPLAKSAFNNRQNRRSIGIEICNNGDWGKAADNAKQWVIDYLRSIYRIVDLEKSLNPQTGKVTVAAGTILIVRHFDLTGKECPKPFIDDPAAWVAFVTDIAKDVNSYPRRPR